VIVHHRGCARLLRTLAAVTAQADAESAEVIVVDNASREGAPEEIRRRFPAARVIPKERNEGFASGCRAGAEDAQAPWLVFLNDDAIPEPGWLARFLETAGTLPADVHTLAGRLTDASGTRVDFTDGFLVFDGHAFADGVGAPTPSDLGGAPGDERLFACGGNMLVRKTEFLESGAFDASYFAYLEDVDFGWRQWIFGRRVLYEPRACARHEGGATGEALGIFNRGFLIEKNAWATAYKNFDTAHFRDLWPAAATAFLWRLDAMLRRDPGTAGLARDPYRVAPVAPWRARWRRWSGIAVAAESVSVGDPLAIAQLRALRAIVDGSGTLARERERVQARRVRPDREIFRKFPLRIVPTYPGDEVFASSFFAPLLPVEAELAARRLDQIMPGPQ
jgi:GT2 family glycosyltransferase